MTSPYFGSQTLQIRLVIMLIARLLPPVGHFSLDDSSRCYTYVKDLVAVVTLEVLLVATHIGTCIHSPLHFCSCLDYLVDLHVWGLFASFVSDIAVYLLDQLVALVVESAVISNPMQHCSLL